ncbi:MAG: NAD-dependent succinate-semialdehyde dehydrogenase [Bacteroidota bacterium]|nr:NAD-dependent succinate-semialdehyde dehydrogenase [Bacteroidota bacterium]
MFESINPATSARIGSYNQEDESSFLYKLKVADDTFDKWRFTKVKRRVELMDSLASSLANNRRHFSVLMTSEMGKPISESEAEISKCIWLCEFYRDNLKSFLKSVKIKSDADSSYYQHVPIGVILGIMPWNFPAWQAFRMAVPAICAGNTVILKHASNVMGSAEMIEKVFREAGFETGVFQNLRISSQQVSTLIRDERVRGVSLTGSDKAGSSVASQAGKELKKSLLELGGSNAFIVFEDADMDLALEKTVKGRFQNTGQSCIANKRLFVQKGIFEKFLDAYVRRVRDLKVGDPIMQDTQIGPMARLDLAETLERQLKESVELGAKVILGGKRDGCFFDPTIITDVEPNMPVMKEEVFGPVIPIVPFDDWEDALRLSNDNEFGLGVSLFTANTSKAKKWAERFDEGAVFVNELVKSDPRLPFGGVKRSGYGRELSSLGLFEFTNVQTVYVDE